MPFFKVTDDDGNQFTYPAQKVYDDIELDHSGNTSRHFHWEAETEYDDILSSDDLPENVEFFEYDDDDDDVDLDYGEFYGDDETTFDKIGLADDEDGDDADESW